MVQRISYSRAEIPPLLPGESEGGTQLVCVLCVWGGSDDNVAPATTRGQGAHEVRFRRDRFSPTGDLVYSGISGAVGLGHRCTVEADPATRPQ